MTPLEWFLLLLAAMLAQIVVGVVLISYKYAKEKETNGKS